MPHQLSGIYSKNHILVILVSHKNVQNVYNKMNMAKWMPPRGMYPILYQMQIHSNKYNYSQYVVWLALQGDHMC